MLDWDQSPRGPCADPLEASATPQARRREGLKPNGRDGKGGTGRSPKARRRIAPTRPGRSSFPSKKREYASDGIGTA
ncbi:MAG: hypothetical protein K8H84_14185 [Sulfuricella denitrificans]|nr:hypothetical protein [Sulfuricella denitrificans]